MSLDRGLRRIRVGRGIRLSLWSLEKVGRVGRLGHRMQSLVPVTTTKKVGPQRKKTHSHRSHVQTLLAGFTLGAYHSGLFCKSIS